MDSQIKWFITLFIFLGRNIYLLSTFLCHSLFCKNLSGIFWFFWDAAINYFIFLFLLSFFWLPLWMMTGKTTGAGRYPYKANGYMSEPEPNYDSDYSFKYSTLDRRRTPSAGSQYDDRLVKFMWIAPKCTDHWNLLAYVSTFVVGRMEQCQIPFVQDTPRIAISREGLKTTYQDVLPCLRERQEKWVSYIFWMANTDLYCKFFPFEIIWVVTVK